MTNELNEMKEMSISDLATPQAETVDTGSATEVAPSDDVVELSIGDIKPYTGTEDPVKKNVDAIFANVDKAINDRIERDESFIDEKMAEMEEKRLEAEASDDDSDIEDTTSGELYMPDDNMFDDLKSDDVEDKETEKQLDVLKGTIKDKIKPVVNAVDLTSFSISKTHVAVTKTLATKDTSKHVADWILLASKKPISMSEFTGYEIEKLNPGASARNRYNTYRDIYETIYSHLVDANKPPFDIWLKNISFFDIPHLYFAIYKACFEGTNSIPYACANKDCNHVFMNDYEIGAMVKYKDDIVKALVEDIINQNTDSPEDASEYKAEMVQISDNYVVTFREPTVWNIIFENAILEEKFTEKYSDFLGLMSYVDEIYYINREINELQPIQVEVDPKNNVKTVKSRVVKYSEVLKSLTSDQFQFLNACIKKINDKYEGLSYVLPEAQCPKCGTVIKEQSMDPDQLLFTRHQLAAIANI